MTRIFQSMRRRVVKWLGYPVPTRYVPDSVKGVTTLKTGYLLIEYIPSSKAQMLSKTWATKRNDVKLRQNLFRGLSRTLLALARIPLPRIGSFVLDDKGYLSLSNRPLALGIHYLENEHIPVDIPRQMTHTAADSFINDLLAMQESRFRHEPNAVNNITDACYQASVLTMMRSVWPCFFRRDLLRGPFFFSLTDLHQSNIFVDDDWNLKCIIDLEWAYSLPVEMIHPPSWLSNQVLQQINLNEYEPLHEEFMSVFEEEEQALHPKSQPPISLHSILQQGLEKGTIWCSYALLCPGAFHDLFYNKIQPMFTRCHRDEESFFMITMHYLTFNAINFLEDKVQEKEQYDQTLRKAFEKPSNADICTA